MEGLGLAAQHRIMVTDVEQNFGRIFPLGGVERVPGRLRDRQLRQSAPRGGGFSQVREMPGDDHGVSDACSCSQFAPDAERTAIAGL